MQVASQIFPKNSPVAADARSMMLRKAERIFEVISLARETFQLSIWQIATVRLLGHSREIDRARMQIHHLRKAHSFGYRFADDNGLAVFFLLFLSRIKSNRIFHNVYI